MKFVVAGGGVAGLASALAIARAGHEAVLLERDAIAPDVLPDQVFNVERGGILARLARDAPGPPGPPRDELLARLAMA